MSALIVTSDSGTWSLGALIGCPAGLLAVAAFLVGGIYLIRLNKHVSDYDRGIPKWLGIGCLVASLVGLAVIASPLGMYPYKAEYHQYRDVSGTVSKIDSRLISAGDKSTETKFVIRFDGSDQQYGCDDTRCAGVEAGDSLTLSCKRAWQYTGTDGYDCRFTSVEAAR